MADSVASTERLTSLDAYRGLAMVLMLGEALHLRRVADAIPGSSFWSFLAYHQTHVEWAGCSLHDLIQPSFTFMVGVSLPFSIASRRSRGESIGRMTVHAFWRAIVLVLLGIFLRSIRHEQTYFTFEDTLTQIGLGYGFLFLLGFRSVYEQVAALLLILVGYWAAFAFYPLPGTDFDWAAAGVAADWPHHYSGFAAHWNKNTNVAWAFDRWFLNLFPRETPFEFNNGGYSTLSFIPTLGTMILGLLAGEVLRHEGTAAKRLFTLMSATVICFGTSLLLDQTGICPIVKRIWTPSWVLFSGGWCFLLTGSFYLVMDVLGFKRWGFPLVVVGMNSIVAYCMEWGAVSFVTEALLRHVGDRPFLLFGLPYEPLLIGGATLIALWCMLYWMYRQRIFVRI